MVPLDGNRTKRQDSHTPASVCSRRCDPERNESRIVFLEVPHASAARLKVSSEGVVMLDSGAMQRNTRQRDAIRTALAEAGRPLAPHEILEAAQEAVPGLGIATVYRTISLLVEEGWAAVVELPDAPPRYERAGKGHHHHFLCTDCDAAYDVTGCPPGVAAMTPKGFELDAHAILLYGRCLDCVTRA